MRNRTDKVAFVLPAGILLATSLTLPVSSAVTPSGEFTVRFRIARELLRLTIGITIALIYRPLVIRPSALGRTR